MRSGNPTEEVVTLKRSAHERAQRQKVEMESIPDRTLRESILSHIARGDCNTSDYTDVPNRMAKCMWGDGPRAASMTTRVRDMLMALEDEGVIVLASRSGKGNIYSATLKEGTAPADPTAAPVRTDQPGAEPSRAGPAPEPEPPEPVLSEPDPSPAEVLHWPPALAVYRKLMLLWLLENGGQVESGNGRIASAFRERFGLPATWAVQQNQSTLLGMMEKDGDIRRQRTADPEDERLSPERWARSKRTYKVTLLRMGRAGEIAQLRDELNIALAKLKEPAAQKTVGPTRVEPAKPEAFEAAAAGQEAQFGTDDELLVRLTELVEVLEARLADSEQAADKLAADLAAAKDGLAAKDAEIRDLKEKSAALRTSAAAKAREVLERHQLS
jgi:hypothetical protein